MWSYVNRTGGRTSAAPDRPRRSWPRRGDRGATAVEFALLTPLLVSLIFGALEGSRLLMADQDAATASREGARYALSGNRFGDCTGVRAAAIRLATRSHMTDTEVTVQYDHGPGTEVFASCPTQSSSLVTGDRIVVTTTRTVTPVVPVFKPVTVSVTERRTVLKNPGS